MITKVKANKSFRGTTKYVLEKEKAKIIGGNMYGRSTNELVEQFTLSAHLNADFSQNLKKKGSKTAKMYI